jgi:hypothetical protein
VQLSTGSVFALLNKSAASVVLAVNPRRTPANAAIQYERCCMSYAPKAPGALAVRHHVIEASHNEQAAMKM